MLNKSRRGNEILLLAILASVVPGLLQHSDKVLLIYDS
ncbi:MAG: hypothetical protein OFPI_05680 [Osedax symbiont Rs2]|nr:MAG: hypothetical protein OFPI_05680 [Osedax symbiont Rs2]